MKNRLPIHHLFMILGLVVLTSTGLAMAQTEPVATDQPTSADPAATGVQTPPTEDGAQPGAAPEPGVQDPAPQAAPAADPATDPASETNQAGTLPATASEAPLLIAIGLVAIAGFAGFLIFRKRHVAQS